MESLLAPLAISTNRWETCGPDLWEGDIRIDFRSAKIGCFKSEPPVAVVNLLKCNVFYDGRIVHLLVMLLVWGVVWIPLGSYDYERGCQLLMGISPESQTTN